MKTRNLLAFTLVAGLLFVPMAASADSHEQPKPLTWLSFVKAQTGKGNALGQHIAKAGAKIYDGLMTEGKIVSWGVAQPINHMAGDEWTHVEWVTFTGWDAVDSFMQGFMAMQMAKSPEEMMAEQKEWYSLVEPGSHYDEIVRHQVLSPDTDGARPAYISLAFYKANRGQGGEVVKLFKEWGGPVLTQAQADGTIVAFGLYDHELHGDDDWTHVAWQMLPSLGARDAVRDAYDAAEEARGEEGQKALMERARAAFAEGGHTDRLLVITHLGGGGGEAGDAGE